MATIIGAVSVRYQLIGDMLKETWYANGVKIGVGYMALDEYEVERLKEEIKPIEPKGKWN